MNHAEHAIELFKNDSTCAQAILSTYAEHFGLDKKTAHKLATGLGGGIGYKQYTCGAINAGAIVLSLKYGSEHFSEIEKKQNTYAKVNKFLTAMEDKLGSSSCSELLGIPIQTEEQREQGKQDGLFDRVCTNCIRAVAEYLDHEIQK